MQCETQDHNAQATGAAGNCSQQALQIYGSPVEGTVSYYQKVSL